MKKICLYLFGLVSFANVMAASCSDTQVFALTIHGICDIVVTPETIALTIDSADTGDIVPVSYQGVVDVVSNATATQMIIVSLDQQLKDDTSLTVDAGNFGHGTGNVVTLITDTSGGGPGFIVTQGQLVTNLLQTQADRSFSGAPVTFIYDVQSIAAIGTETRTLTYTLQDQS